MTYLSRLTKLGLGKESTQGTYVVPTVSVPWDTAEYEDATSPLRDESVRANDVVLQGLAQGVYQADWALTTNAYPDFIGHWFVAMGMFDTVSGGASTTLTTNASANATTFTLTSAVGVSTGSVLKIADTAGANTEYVTVGSLAGPVVTIGIGGGTGGNSLLYSHVAAGGSVVAQYTHTFKQLRTFSTVWPSYSLTTNDGVEQRGWAGNVASELAIKIDPKGLIKVSPKFTGWQSATQADFSYAAVSPNPLPGWGWTVTNGGGSSTRGLTMDLTLKRATEAIHASSGTRGPREVFAGALEVDGTYKAIFESITDINLFRTYIQQPTVHTLTQPVVQFGGSTLVLTMSVSGYVTAKVSTSGPYQMLDTTMAGVANTTDGNTSVGVVSATLTNYSSTAF
jgi:hypothetical protein